MGALGFEGLLSSLLLVLFVFASILVVVTIVVGAPLYVFVAGLFGLSGTDAPDFWAFMAAVGIAVGIFALAAVSAR